jgi:tetraacyldisaccharide 4'-kinase
MGSRPELAQRLQQAWLRRGALACLLWPLALLFGAAVRARGALLRMGWLHRASLPAPVVVVGNLIAGGAGKTPTVMAVVTLLRQRGFRPGVISRGHGRAEDGVLQVSAETPAERCGDEPRLLHARRGVPVVVGRDRVAAAQELLRRHPEVNVLVSDDGLQHRRLPRAAQVLVFDERGAGNGWLLPAGPLREPLPRQVPPRTVVLYNAPAPSTHLPGHLAHRSLRGVVSLRAWRSGAGAREPLQRLMGRVVLAAAGVAHPARFFGMLRDAGLQVQELPLPDHYDFATLPWPLSTEDVVVTEKDATKLDPARMGATRVWVAPLDFDPGSAFEAELLALLPSPPNDIVHGHPTA